jgi:hypothetical protein
MRFANVTYELGALVEVTTLAKAVVYSLVAGIGIATAFGVCVTSAAGLLDAVRTRRTGLAVAWATAAVLCGALVLGGVAAGIVVMTNG